ncbi:major tail protein [Mycobacterium phage Aragog]|uniref:Major tail protein n=2 Tax=Benedictvirus TaxID=2946819 RepID=A0A5Q2WF91_9CAUD|nr:major tail protein [Mycobacterium phage Jovo]YP_010060899.1 major tail protein [Mycobacterium phage Bluefalcon]ATW59993.1 major tail protein [Mycobacterium phage Phlorence]ATW60413.1 major tail protein [Mycobacterium phage ForGetIt]ATW60965.1 major tail protein [Mycobacterium phage Aragog]ATW61207.1 major tail protein [Mycobacterium phage AgentM]QGJ97217.1 major tail protein [Mycobacterium phage Lev2]WNM67837.1 major tail protein [Mycobacterium phage Discoknowium]
MAQNDAAVLTAAVGYGFIANPGTPAPTPSELAALDPETFGSKVVTISGSPTDPFDLEIAGELVEEVAASVNAAALQVAIEEVLGEGAVLVSGTSLATGLDVTFIGPYQGLDVEVDAVGDVTVTTKTNINGWTPVGHTSENDMPEFGYEGGDTEVRNTWQKKKLREVQTDEPVDYLTMFLHQFDTQSFELYYGKNAADTPGVFGVEGNARPVEKALLVIIVDGDEKVGFYAAKASIKRDDAIQLPNDDFAALPVRATFLKMAGRRLFDWINAKLFK